MSIKHVFAQLATCKRKVPYASIELADIALKQRTLDRFVGIYKCRFCNYYHIGRLHRNQYNRKRWCYKGKFEITARTVLDTAVRIYDRNCYVIWERGGK